MKRPVFIRIISLVMVYAVFFVILVVIQFANHRSFTLRVGDFVVSGNYGNRTAGTEASQGDQRLLEGDASVLYGGMEFFLAGDGGDNSLGLLTSSGGRERVRLFSMSISDHSALFQLSGGVEISFTGQHNGETQELRIKVNLPEGCQGLELPYRLLRSSRIRRNADGESHVISGGKSYRFNASTMDYTRRLVIIDVDDPVASYGTVPGDEALDPSQFILSAARDRRQYDEALNRWRDQSFTLWRVFVEDNPDEETVLACLAESASRDAYQAEVAAVSSDFLESARRSFMSSAYLGRMDLGLRSNLVYERENLSRLSRLITERSADCLQDSHVIEFLAVRSYDNLIDNVEAIVSSLDSADLEADLIPGILEGYMDWQLFRPNTGNPFERLASQACFSLSEQIVPLQRGERILMFAGEQADLEFNSRLGAALTAYGEYTGEEIWAGIGRSLVLSVLAFADGTGTAPLTLSLAADGGIEADPGATLSSARIYRLLRLGDYSARAVSLQAATNGIWTWTAASAVNASFNQEIGLLDISVSFPRGQTHYMLIHGIRPFSQLRLYDIPYRTDPRFESYDSSGWTYSPSEQTLMVKMKHQIPVERIQIYY